MSNLKMHASRRKIVTAAVNAAGLSVAVMPLALVRAQTPAPKGAPAKSLEPSGPALGDAIVIGQTAALTGGLSFFNLAHNAGAAAAFSEVNAKGGIHGRKLKFVSLDDAYDPQRAVVNFNRLIGEEKAFALFSIGGLPANQVLTPLILKGRIPHIAPATGADYMRVPLNPVIFHVRASYGDEINKLVEHVKTVGIKRIACVYSGNPFGLTLLSALDAACKVHGATLVTEVALEDKPGADDEALTKLFAKPFDALFLIAATAGPVGIALVKKINATHKGTQLFTLSLLASPLALKALGADAVGLSVSQVMPSPTSATSPLVRDYQAAMKAAGATELTYPSIEGFVNARILIAGLQAAGKDLTREKLVAAMDKLQFDLGGLPISFTPENHIGSRYVDLTLVGSGGRFIR